MQREGVDGASAREAGGEGRPRAAKLNGVSFAVFRVKEQAVTAAEGRPNRANMGGTAGDDPRPVANAFSLRFFYFFG